jgi:hypothetical protein
MLGTTATFGPIEREPRRVRPPYDVPDTALAHRRHGHETEAEYVARRHADRLAAMLEPLQGIDISAYERRTVEWIVGWEISTTAVFAALLHRARAAAPLASGGHQAGEGR